MIFTASNFFFYFEIITLPLETGISISNYQDVGILKENHSVRYK